MPIFYDERVKTEWGGSAGANWLDERLRIAQPQLPARKPAFVEISRLDELRALKNSTFDCTRLIAMCEELNDCAEHGNAHAVAMLTRAIVDHVPPLFGFSSFEQVAANYGGTKEKSFKKAMERLDKHTKKVADRLLHGQITKSEVAPTMAEVSYSGEVNHLLSEVYRRLKNV